MKQYKVYIGHNVDTFHIETIDWEYVGTFPDKESAAKRASELYQAGAYTTKIVAVDV